jgi:hypothetical protein
VTRAIPFDTATEMLRQPGYTLMKMFTNTKRGKEYYIVGKRGGPVTDAVAAQILKHPQCHAVDAGLFPGIEQSFSLYHGT